MSANQAAKDGLRALRTEADNSELDEEQKCLALLTRLGWIQINVLSAK